MSFSRDRALSPEDRSRARDSAREAHRKAVGEQRAAIEAREDETPEFVDAGYEDTLPGQVEVVAGSVEHEKVLSAFHNATSYGPDVNVVVPAPETEGEGAAGAPTVVDTPHVQQNGAELSCTMGNWEGEPTSYAYEWFFDGDSIGPGGDKCTAEQDDIGKTATCVVSATNAAGTTKAPPSDGVVVEPF